MSPHRPSRFLLVLALLVGVQVAYVNPGVAAVELRALSCCAHDCDQPVSLPAARRCCGVTVMASGPAETPTTQVIGTTDAIRLPMSCTVVAPPAPHRVAIDAVQITGAGPPTFLAQRHILR